MDGVAESISGHKERNYLKSKKRNTLTIVLFFIYMLLLIGIVLFKLPFYSPQISDGIRVINLIPYQGAFDGNGFTFSHEIIYNVLLFIPLGIYACMLKSDWPLIKKLLFIIGLAFAFEAIQYVFAIGRSDITDIINNKLGGIIGIGIYALLQKIFKGRTHTVVNILAFAVTIIVVLRFAHLFYLSHFVMMRPAL